MHKISYDLPIDFYPRDFFFEKKNKDCVDFLSVKILTSLGRISTVRSKLPPLKILPHEVNILTSKNPNKPCLSFQRKTPCSNTQLVDPGNTKGGSITS